MKLNEKILHTHDLRELNVLTECSDRIRNNFSWRGHTIEIYGYDDDVHVMILIKKMHDIQMEFTLFEPTPAECTAGIAVCATILQLVAEYDASLKNQCALKKIVSRIADFFQCFFSSAERRLQKMLYVFESLQKQSKKDYHLNLSKMFN